MWINGINKNTQKNDYREEKVRAIYDGRNSISRQKILTIKNPETIRFMIQNLLDAATTSHDFLKKLQLDDFKNQSLMNHG